MKTHIQWIDSLKGFAMLCVVLGHVADGYLAGLALSPGETGFLSGLINLIYSFHMPLFMWISGFLFHQAYYDRISRTYSLGRIRKQCLNLAGVYVFFSILFGVFKIIFSGNVNNPLTVTDILMIWCRPIAPYWYLYVLIMLYVFFSRKQICSIGENTLLLLTVLLLLSSVAVTEMTFELHRFLYNSFFFWLGILYCRNRAHPLFSRPAVLALFALSLLCFAVFWRDSRNLNDIPVISCVTALGITLVLVQLFEKAGRPANNPALRAIGRASLEIYVTHCFLTAGFRTILPKVGIQNIPVSMLINWTLSTLIPLAAAEGMKRLGIHGLFFKPYTCISGHIPNK